MLALAAGIPAALADDGQVREVSIPGKVYAPARLQVLVGDTVVWRNGDATTHTVTADDGAFDSGYLDSGLSFSLQFSKLGHYAYHCTIHKFMHGEIVVVAGRAARARPSRSSAGGRVVLQGLAPVGVKSVVVTSVGSGAGAPPPRRPGRRRQLQRHAARRRGRCSSRRGSASSRAPRCGSSWRPT